MAAVSKRKRHVQQSLFRRGGRRRGAGRKPHGTRSGERHAARPDFKPYHPLHIVMRVGAAVGSLRRREMYQAIRAASIAAARSERLRIVHVSLQREHVHMLVEADDKVALARGMQSFTISAAKNINRALGIGAQPRRGRVFTDRYHLTVITSPRQARNSLSYVLNNWRHHREDRSGLPATWLVDPFSTGILFPDWTERQGEPWMWPFRETYDPLVVYRPRSWLLRDGWKKAGPISYRGIAGTPSAHAVNPNLRAPYTGIA